MSLLEGANLLMIFFAVVDTYSVIVKSSSLQREELSQKDLSRLFFNLF